MIATNTTPSIVPIPDQHLPGSDLDVAIWLAGFYLATQPLPNEFLADRHDAAAVVDCLDGSRLNQSTG